MNRKKLTILFIGMCLIALIFSDFLEARGGGRGGGGRGGGGFSRGGGGFSRGSGGGYGSIRNSARPSTRDVSRPSRSYDTGSFTGGLSRPSSGSLDRTTQGLKRDLSPSHLPSYGDSRIGESGYSGEQRQNLQERASNLTPDQKQALQDRAGSLTPEQKQSLQEKTANLTPDQKQSLQDKAADLTPDQKQEIKDRMESLTPEQKDELRQKFEDSGLRADQLPVDDEDREDWQEWRDENREDWQDWYEDEYEDYWDDHWHSTWWYGYPVSSVSYHFYVDDDPPCQNKVMVNQATGYTTYYQCNSVWYQPAYASGDVKYVVSSPPAGAELATLSSSYVVIVNDEDYYVSNHAFYQKFTRNGQPVYVLVDPPIGAKVNTIPQYAVEIQHGGLTYYRFDKIFYQKQGDGFLVVANPGV